MAKYFSLIQEKIYWTWRSFFWGYPIIKEIEGWQMPDPLTQAHFRRIVKSWEFLRPFFASHGYILYQRRDPLRVELYAMPFPKPAEPEDLHYPYSRRFYNTDEEGNFPFISMYCWAARDTQGRDVVIKLISNTGPNPSNELKVLKYLNSDEVRSDPRNHTIHALEFLTYESLMFVVMPRWDPACSPAFENIEQIVDYAEAFLEGLAFLHEHRIYHGDIFAQNSGINCIAEQYPANLPPTGRRDPAHTRYVFYDFGGSLMLPRDVSLEDSTADNYIGWTSAGFPPVRGEPFNPFPVDVLRLAKSLEYHLRHVENFVPELGMFFDWMKEVDIPKRPTAQQALTEFRVLRRRLTPDQLAQTICSVYWTKDETAYIDGDTITWKRR